MIAYQAQFTCSHVLCYISDCLMGPQSVCVNLLLDGGIRVSTHHESTCQVPCVRSRRHSRHCPRRYNPATDSTSTFHGMAPHSLKHDPHPRQRRETSFALLPSTTRSSLLSCSRRGSIPINCFCRAASKNFVPKSAVLSNVSTPLTFTCPSTLACCNQRLLKDA